jgi:hypothetical protein
MEAESKELKELERMKAVKILHAYQDETWGWRDKKVKEKTIEVGDIVLLRSPHIEASGKLEPKWIGPYLVTKKNKARVFPFGRHRRQDVAALMERQQSCRFLTSISL